MRPDRYAIDYPVDEGIDVACALVRRRTKPTRCLSPRTDIAIEPPLSFAGSPSSRAPLGVRARTGHESAGHSANVHQAAGNAGCSPGSRQLHLRSGTEQLAQRCQSVGLTKRRGHMREISRRRIGAHLIKESVSQKSGDLP